MERTRFSAAHGQALLDIALQFGSTLSLDTLLPLVLERATTLLGADRGLFCLCDSEGRVERAVVHKFDWAGPGHPLPVSQSLIRRCLEATEPIVVADATADEQFQANRSVLMHSLRFMMGAPIPLGDQNIGVLYVDSTLSRNTDLDSETSLLFALAKLVGTAVENARLFEEQRYRAWLLATMVHDLRTPLSVVLSNTEYLVEHRDPEVREIATDMMAGAHRMRRMVANTLEFSRADAGRGAALRNLSIGKELPEHIRSLEPLATPSQLTLRVQIADDASLEISTIEDRVWIVVDNLIFNAIRHAKPRSAITVSVCLRSNAGPIDATHRQANGPDLFARLDPITPTHDARFVEISVHNHGKPVPPDLLPILFAPYTRGEKSTRRMASTGLGLSISDQCVRHLGGAIWCRSTAEAGTRFAFTLPVTAILGIHDTQEITTPMTHIFDH